MRLLEIGPDVLCSVNMGQNMTLCIVCLIFQISFELFFYVGIILDKLKKASNADARDPWVLVKIVVLGEILR